MEVDYEVGIGCRIEDELMNGFYYWYLEYIFCIVILVKEEVSFVGFLFFIGFCFNFGKYC